MGERSRDSERLHSFSTVALASLCTPRGQKALDEAAESTSSPSPTPGNSTLTGQSVTRLPAHSGAPRGPWPPAHACRAAREWPLNTKAQTLMRTHHPANAGSASEDACPRCIPCACGYTCVHACFEKPFSPHVRITCVQNPGTLFRSYFWKNVDSHNSNKRKILPQPT